MTKTDRKKEKNEDKNTSKICHFCQKATYFCWWWWCEEPMKDDVSNSSKDKRKKIKNIDRHTHTDEIHFYIVLV